MSWTELSSDAPFVLRESPFESARFGVSVDRGGVGLVSPSGLDEVCDAVQLSTASVVILRYPAEHVTWFARLGALGRRPILADSLVYWSLPTGKGRRPAPQPHIECSAEPAGDALAELVADIFGGYSNHYLANPLFDPELALAGYQEWAVRSVQAQPAVYLRLDGNPVGLATLDDQEATLEIELAGVVTEQQGRGLYGHLLGGVEDIAQSRGREAVVISTQGHNHNVQRAWARYGFEPVASFLTVHLVQE